MIAALSLAQIPSSSAITIDAGHGRPISRYIYGVNYPDTFLPDWLKDWDSFHDGFTLAREGGNRFTAYNWETNASNAGADYFNENDDYLGVSNEPGWTVSQFLRSVQNAGAAALLTVPTLGFVSADKTTEMNGSRDVGKTPDYLNTRFFRSLPSNPLRAGKKPNFPPDTTDRAVYQDEFVAWVESVKSSTTPVWFSLDNEPDYWQVTHARIERNKTTYARILENSIQYAAMIKNQAPRSMVFGPANFGWSGMRDFSGAPDAAGRPFVPTYLDAMRIASSKAGHRLLDVYDFHWYPESRGDGVRITFDNRPDKPATATARIEAPRSLWDPTFVENTWITNSLGGKPILLLPMITKQIADHFPGTKMAITEYDFGGRNSISGALAQADVLGVFGRYGVFAACQWGLTHKDTAAYAGFRAFTDFDRHGAKFGDLGLEVTGEVPERNSLYAALDSKNRRRMTVVTINKTEAPQEFQVHLRNFRGRSAQSYVIQGDCAQPTAGNARVLAGDLLLTAPPLSIVTTEIK